MILGTTETGRIPKWAGKIDRGEKPRTYNFQRQRSKNRYENESSRLREELSLKLFA
jgi:protein subunit release factor A